MEIETKERIGNFFRDYIMEIVIAIACAAYILLGVTQIVKTGKTVAEIVASGAMAFIFGFCICRLFAYKGIKVGENDERFVRTMNEFSNVVERTIPFLSELDGYCKERIEKALKMKQTRILASAGMEYSKFKNGEYAGKDLKKYERIALSRAAHAKVYQYSTYELMSENGMDDDSERKRRNKKQFLSASAIYNGINKILSALVFGYFGLALLGEFSWASLMWSVVQVAFFLVSGAISYVNSIDFIVDEYRGRIIDKMNVLEEFHNQRNKKTVAKADNEVKEKAETEVKETEKTEEEQTNGTIQTV